jgi:shikimate dehydrogenase
VPANYKFELVGVLGFPVAENPTCVMQDAAFAALGLPWRYLTIEVKPESLPDAIRGVRALGMMGVNLTIPHKVAVIPLLDEISKDAAIIGAVNTVRRAGDKLIGENTDGKGFLRGVREEANIDPAGKNILVLGAGGAARAITVELALAGAGSITVWNRSAERGETLCRHLKQKTSADARFVPWRGTCPVGADVDILVNATSIGLFPETEAMPDVDFKNARHDLLVCDVVPNPPET